MITLLKRIKENLIKLTWIGVLVQAEVITPFIARAIEGAIYTAYFGIFTYLYQAIESNVWTNWKATAIVIAVGFAKTILEVIIKTIRSMTIPYETKK